MYKQIIRKVALILAVTLIMSTSAFAIDIHASSRISRSSARVRVGNNGELWVYFSITASSTMDDIGASEIAIQRYNGSRWATECTLTSADEPDIQTQNAIRHSATVSYTPQYSGYAYRAVVFVYATNSSGTSTTSATSTQVII